MRPAEKPLAVILFLNECYKVIILSPNGLMKIYPDWYDGPNTSLGKFRDEGYKFSTIKKKIPKWVHKYVSSQYIIYGVCSIVSFPTKCL